jgi:hypothetical protein
MVPKLHMPARTWTAISLFLLLIAYASLAQSPNAQASSTPGTISIVPATGPVGTPMQIGINLFPSAPIQYALSATTTSPNSGGCANSVPFPGLGPILVTSQGGVVNVNWPSAFAHGQYWLCAKPASGTGDQAKSTYPFVVTDANSPTPTSTPAAPRPSASVSLPAAGVLPGTAVTVVVSNWFPPDGQPPSHVSLIPLSDNGSPGGGGAIPQATPVPFTVQASGAAGSYTVVVSLPATTPPGMYAVRVQEGDLQTDTAPFAVVLHAVAPTPTPAVGSPDSSTHNATPPYLVIGLAVGGLLLLVVLILAFGASRRGRI